MGVDLSASVCASPSSDTALNLAVKAFSSRSSAARLSALCRIPSPLVWTDDSVSSLSSLASFRDKSSATASRISRGSEGQEAEGGGWRRQKHDQHATADHLKGKH